MFCVIDKNTKRYIGYTSIDKNRFDKDMYILIESEPPEIQPNTEYFYDEQLMEFISKPLTDSDEKLSKIEQAILDTAINMEYIVAMKELNL